MKRGISLFVGLLTLALLIEMVSVTQVSANPSPLGKMIDPPSNAIPPIISIYSPQNNTNHSGTFNASIGINESQYNNFVPDVVNVRYIIDNESLNVPFDGKSVHLDLKNKHCQYNASFALPNLLSGNHTLTVEVEGIEYRMYLDYFLINSTSKVYFAVSDNSKGFNSLSIPAILITMIIVVSISLVYFRRRKLSHEESDSES
jgi:hypothetical protein